MKYTKDIRDFIYANYKGIGNQELTDMINEKFGTEFRTEQIKGFKNNHHLNSGLTGRFEKGHVPYTKGKARSEWITDPKVEARCRQFHFSKGHICERTRPLGSLRIDAKDGYTLIKVAEKGRNQDKWKLLHRVIWERANGPIPKGMKLIFKDGDKSNCDLSNLMLISSSEHAYMNQHHLRSSDPEATTAALSVAKLHFRMNELSKKVNKHG